MLQTACIRRASMPVTGNTLPQTMAFSSLLGGSQQNGKQDSLEQMVLRRLYASIVANGDEQTLIDLSRSIASNERKLFHVNEGKIKSLKMFLNKNNHIFNVTRDSVKGREIVRPIVNIEFCKVFDSKQGCDDGSCPRLHICRHFVKGKCTFGTKCKKPHHFEDPHTLSVLRTHFLDGLSHTQLKEFLCRNVQFALDDSLNEASLPKQLEICKYYNVAIGCSREGICPFLHVCRFYAEDGTCKFGQKCIRKHDCGNEHAQFILRRYNIKQSEVFSYLRQRSFAGKHSCPLDDKPSPYAVSNITDMNVKFTNGRRLSIELYDGIMEERLIPGEPPDLANWGPKVDNLICTKAFMRRCEVKYCQKLHKPMPYCWQYTSDCKNWNDVSRKENVKIESMFVNPAIDDVTVEIGEKQHYIFKFAEKTGIRRHQGPLLLGGMYDSTFVIHQRGRVGIYWSSCHPEKGLWNSLPLS